MTAPAAHDAICLVVIDDDTFVFELLRRRLRGTNVDLVCFRDIEEAVDYLASHTPHVLLVDERMPSASGLDVLRRIHHQDQFKTYRAYLCSAAEVPRHVQLAAKALGATTLTKDVYSNKEQLLEICNEKSAPMGYSINRNG